MLAAIIRKLQGMSVKSRERVRAMVNTIVFALKFHLARLAGIK